MRLITAVYLQGLNAVNLFNFTVYTRQIIYEEQN